METKLDGYEDEPTRQNRAFYLHEAGHVVIGRHYGFITKEVRCNGLNDNYVDQDPPPGLTQQLQDLIAAYNDKTVAPEVLVEMALRIHEGKMVTLLGGLAGESLERGRPLTSIARSADDLSQILIMLTIALGRLPTMRERQERLTSVFQSMSEKADKLAKQFRPEIEALADALQAKHQLSKDEVEKILAEAKPGES